VIWVFDAEGLLTRWENFDLDQEAAALARFGNSRRDGSTVTSRP
jgi:hypothetical protein